MRVYVVCGRENVGGRGLKDHMKSGIRDAAVIEELIIGIESLARKWNYHRQENKNKPTA
jgi:hypothetical protein